MSRGLDHIVHAVRDLDTAGMAYRRLGFTVGAPNRHPWGTENRIVQFPGFFIELLAVPETANFAPRPRGISFAAFNREFLAAGEGFSMLVLESRNAAADADAFRSGAIGDFDVFHFEREGKRPDGSSAKVAFSLAYAADPAPARAGFFTCQQHFPENFWNASFQTHENGAAGVGGVVLVAENPTDHHIFFSAFVGERELDATSSGIKVRTPRGDIQVMDPAAFRIHYGVEPPPIDAGMRIAALRLNVASIEKTQNALASHNVPATERMGRLVVASAQAHGAVIVFEGARE